MAWKYQCYTCMTLKQMVRRRNSQFLWVIEVQSLDFIIINNSQIALPPPSTSLQFLGLLQMEILLLLCLQTILYLPLICQMQCLATNMSNAVPVENSNFSKFKSPEDYISLKSSKMDCLELNLCKRHDK